MSWVLFLQDQLNDKLQASVLVQDSRLPLFGTTVVQSCTLVFDRVKLYTTASLKLITSRLGSSLDTNHPC